jgi:peptidoglycan/LPS O-acetylase OafA/YrhL
MSLVLTGKYSGAQHLWTFYSNRFLRLYPTYLIALLITLGLVIAAEIQGLGDRAALVTDLANRLAGRPAQLDVVSTIKVIIPILFLFGSDLLFLFHRTVEGVWVFTFGTFSPGPGAMLMGGYLLIAPTWSIGLELWFYLLIPFMVRWRLWLLALVAALSFGLHALMSWRLPWSSYFFFPANIGFFLTGTIMQQSWNTLKLGARLPPKLILAGALGGLFLLIFREYIPFYRNYAGFHYVVAAGAIPFIFHITKKVNWDRWIGNLSYPVYIFHVAVVIFCGNYLHNKDSALIVPIVLAISALANFLLEEPLERLRARRVKRDKPSTIPSGEPG